MTDNLKIIKCPACHKEMVKIFVKAAGVNVDICLNGCGGIYFDNMEFYTFDENRENIYEITQAIEGRVFHSVDTSKDRYCPVCGKKMVKNFTNLSKSVEVDDCYNCGGKFLDYGELEKIRCDNMTTSERKKEFVRQLYRFMEFSEPQNENKYRKHKRTFLKKMFDRIFFGQ